MPVLLFLLILALATPAAAQGGAPAQDRTSRAFTLGERVWVVLPAGWVEKPKEDVPPPSLLVASAPNLLFHDILVLENVRDHAVLKVAFSENPYFGTSAQLDGQMRAGMLAHLFYFGFPPPRSCIAETKAHVERKKREAEAKRDKDDPPPLVSVTQLCQFASTPMDFYAEQVSPGFTMDSNGRVTPAFRSFIPLSMQQLDHAGYTFYIFEAQGQRLLDRPDLEKYNLAEDIRGARAYYFWAVGAETPFPFARDPLRRNVPLLHVIYAALSTTGTAFEDFRDKLTSVRFSRP